MKFLTIVFALSILFSSAHAMNQAGYSDEALGITTNEKIKSQNNLISYPYNSNNVMIDESLIDQLISSFTNNNGMLFDESLIDQLIASFPDTIESYRLNNPSLDISYYEILINTYRS